MIPLLIQILVLIIVAGIILYGIDTFITDTKMNQIMKFFLVVVLAIFVINALTGNRLIPMWR